MQRRSAAGPGAPPSEHVASLSLTCSCKRQANPSYAVFLASGAVAGAAVEALLFPIDCLKTRAQSHRGIHGVGAFHGIYRGVGTAVVSAAPASAIFFTVYEFTKGRLRSDDPAASSLRQCGAAVVASIFGELASCSVRVPADLVKQRVQAGCAGSFREAARDLLASRGSILLASFRATAVRDVAHSGLQFPIYEGLQLVASQQPSDGPIFAAADRVPALRAAACGSIAGALSAVLTTPLDLLRTRLNLCSSASAELASARPSWRVLVAQEALEVHRAKGIAGFFAGASFRAAYMGAGGFVFLGAFDLVKNCIGGSCGSG